MNQVLSKFCILEIAIKLTSSDKTPGQLLRVREAGDSVLKLCRCRGLLITSHSSLVIFFNLTFRSPDSEQCLTVRGQ